MASCGYRLMRKDWYLSVGCKLSPEGPPTIHLLRIIIIDACLTCSEHCLLFDIISCFKYFYLFDISLIHLNDM